MGTPDELKIYLCGSEPLPNRLECAKKAFLAPLEVPTNQKEDVVVLWLTRLVTTKALVLSAEELEAVWKTLEDILSSHRLKALCESGWMCLLGSSFMETLVSLITRNSESSEDSVQCYAVRICHILLNNPRLAPLVTHQPNQCLYLLKGLIEWLIKGHKSNEDISLTLMLTLEVSSYLKYNVDKKSTMTSVVDHIFLPSARLHIAFKNEDRDIVKSLLNELKSLVTLNLFNEDLQQMYNDALLSFFSEETKIGLPEDVEKIFSCILTVISSETVELSEHLLFEFFSSFSITFRNRDDMSYKMLVVLSFMIGVSVKGSNVLSISKNNFACQRISLLNVDSWKEETLLSSLLLAVKNVHLNHDVRLEDIAANRWLQNLGDYIMKYGLRTASGCRCLQTLLQINPKNTVYLILNNFGNIIKCMERAGNLEVVTTIADRGSCLHAAIDDLLCGVLEVYRQLREVPNMFVSFLHCLLKNPWVLENCAIVPETLHVYEGNLLFPPRFMFSTMKVFNNLGHTNVIATWKVFLSLLTENFSKCMSESAVSCKLKLVSVAVWLFTCILRAFPIMDVIAVAGVAQNVAELMNQTAKEGIQPFIAAMLTLPHNNDICGTLLLLCHTWGELHTNLCTYDKYLECPDVSPVQLPESSQQAADFSYLLPFISPDMWAQISARVANFGNQPTQLALVQLVLQKLSHVTQHHENNFDVRCDEQSMVPTRQIIEAATKYLLNALEVWGTGVMQLLTVHLTYLLPFIHDVHLPTIAKYLVNGFKEEKGYWLDYVHSDHFLEAYRLHPHVLSCICSTLVAGLSSKRKLSESEDDVMPKKNYVKKLFTKLANVVSVSIDSGTSDGTENLKIKMLRECGALLGKLIESKRKAHETSGCVRNIDVMNNLLRRLPFTYLSWHNKTAVLFILLSILANNEFNSKQENVDLLHSVTILLRSQKSVCILSVIDVDILVKWLIQKRLSLPVSVLSPIVIPLTKVNSEIVSRPQEEQIDNVESSPTLDVLISDEYDLLVRSILISKECTQKVDYLQNLAEYITTSEELSADMESRLHVAVLLLSVCQRNPKLKYVKEVGESCKLAFQDLSSWILQFLKKSDLATIPPYTAASLLIAHTIIVSENAKSIVKKENDSNTLQDPSETVVTANDSTAGMTPSKKKTPKYLKLLDRSIKLSELCLSSSNPHLVEHALNFLIKIGERSSILKSRLPPNLLADTWSTLCQRDHLSTSGELSQLSKFCLFSLMTVASSEEFEKILKDLIRETQTQTNIAHTLALWQIVILSKVNVHNATLKRTAMEHLIPMLVNLVTLQNLETSSAGLLIAVVETVRVVIKSGLWFSPQSKALSLKICAAIQLHTLPLDQFHKVFSIVVDIMNSILLQYSDFAMQRIPSVLAIIGQFSEALIAQSSQDHNLGEKELMMLVDCSNNFERLVKFLLSHRNELKRLIHSTIARIVISLQLTVVYQDVRIILETIVYHLLDICSEHGLNHLLVALPPANTTLLKHLHKNYKDFYRYRSNAGARRVV